MEVIEVSEGNLLSLWKMQVEISEKLLEKRREKHALNTHCCGRQMTNGQWDTGPGSMDAATEPNQQITIKNHQKPALRVAFHFNLEIPNKTSKNLVIIIAKKGKRGGAERSQTIDCNSWESSFGFEGFELISISISISLRPFIMQIVLVASVFLHAVFAYLPALFECHSQL